MGPVSTLRSINGSQAPSPNGPLRVAFFFQQSTQGQAGTELGWVGFFLLATAGFRFWALLNRFWDDDEHEIESSRSHFRADCGSRSPDWVVFFFWGGGGFALTNHETIDEPNGRATYSTVESVGVQRSFLIVERVGQRRRELKIRQIRKRSRVAANRDLDAVRLRSRAYTEQQKSSVFVLKRKERSHPSWQPTPHVRRNGFSRTSPPPLPPNKKEKKNETQFVTFFLLINEREHSLLLARSSLWVVKSRKQRNVSNGLSLGSSRKETTTKAHSATLGIKWDFKKNNK